MLEIFQCFLEKVINRFDFAHASLYDMLTANENEIEHGIHLQEVL